MLARGTRLRRDGPAGAAWPGCRCHSLRPLATLASPAGHRQRDLQLNTQGSQRTQLVWGFYNKEMQAVRASADPRTLDDPAAAFADAPPVPFVKPARWPGPEAASTVARLLWDDSKLYIAYSCEGSFADAIDPARCNAGALSALQNAYDPSYSDPRLQRVVMLDDRVEVFLWQRLPGVPFQSYWAFEINKAGRALTNINQSVTERGGRTTFDREWDGRAALDASLLQDGSTMLVALDWSELGVRPGTSSLQLGLFRAEKPAELTAKILDGTSEIDAELATEIEGSLIWSAWTDPGDDVVDFHRTAFFGELQLLGADGKEATLRDRYADADPMSARQGLLDGLLATVRGWFGDSAEDKRHKARL